MTTTCRPLQDVLEGLGLMRVELRDAARLKRRAQPRIDARRERRVDRFHRRQAAHRRHDLVWSVGPVESLAGVEHAQRLLESRVFGLGR